MVDGFSRVTSAPMAAGASAESGFCQKPGHANFEESMWCADCDAKFCIRCTAAHIGHNTMDSAQAQFFRRTTSVPVSLVKRIKQVTLSAGSCNIAHCTSPDSAISFSRNRTSHKSAHQDRRLKTKWPVSGALPRPLRRPPRKQSRLQIG
jgi:hypothetical protein